MPWQDGRCRTSVVFSILRRSGPLSDRHTERDGARFWQNSDDEKWSGGTIEVPLSLTWRHFLTPFAGRLPDGGARGIWPSLRCRSKGTISMAHRFRRPIAVVEEHPPTREVECLRQHPHHRQMTKKTCGSAVHAAYTIPCICCAILPSKPCTWLLSRLACRHLLNTSASSQSPLPGRRPETSLHDGHDDSNELASPPVHSTLIVAMSFVHRASTALLMACTTSLLLKGDTL